MEWQTQSYLFENVSVVFDSTNKSSMHNMYEGCSKITWTFALTGNSFDTEKQKLYDIKRLFFFFSLCKFQTIRTCN